MNAITSNQIPLNIAALPAGKKRIERDHSEAVGSKKQRILNEQEAAAAVALATLKNSNAERPPAPAIAQIPRSFYPVLPGMPLVHFERGETEAGTFSAISAEGFIQKKGDFVLMRSHSAMQLLSQSWLSLPSKIGNHYPVFLLNKTALAILGLFSPFKDRGLNGAYFLKGPIVYKTRPVKMPKSKEEILNAITEMGRSNGKQSLEELGNRYLAHIKTKKERVRKLRACFSAIAIAVKALKEGTELSETIWSEIYEMLRPRRPSKKEFQLYLQAVQGYESVFIDWFVKDRSIRLSKSNQRSNVRLQQKVKTQRNIEIIKSLIVNFLSMDKQGIDQTGFQQLAQKIEHQKKGMKAQKLQHIFAYIAKALAIGLTGKITDQHFEKIKQENGDLNIAVISKQNLQKLLGVVEKRGAEFQERFEIIKLMTF